MTYSIKTEQLSYRFPNGTPALNNISINVPKGSIYGFLGPNGAGKTTTLRLILGLLRKQEGSISVFDQPLEQHRVSILRRVGSLIETPSLYAHLTAMENLAIWQTVYQCPKTRLPEVLALVGLQDTGRKKAGQFSLGMKQRLSIAVALLHRPELVILDEPTNGLDPNGILEMRELLKKLNAEEGITMVISSHLLAEVEKTATHVGVIHQGSIRFEGTLQDLLNRQQARALLHVRTQDDGRALTLLQSQYPNATLSEGKLLLPLPSPTDIANLNGLLVQAGVGVYGLSPLQNDLESSFIELVK